MTSLDLLYSKTLLDDPRRTWASDPELFVDVALRTLLDPEARAALLAALVERAGGRPPEPDDAMAAQLAREGLVGVDPETLVEIVSDRDRLAGLCVCLETLEEEAGAAPEIQEAHVANEDPTDDSDNGHTIAQTPAVEPRSAETDAVTESGAVSSDTIAEVSPVSSDTIAEVSPIEANAEGVMDSAQLRGFAGLGLLGSKKKKTTLRGATTSDDEAPDAVHEDDPVDASDAPDGEAPDDEDDDEGLESLTLVAADVAVARDQADPEPADGSLVHARDEDSVLFNLNKMAKGGRSDAPERAAGQPADAAPGSGLLDLAGFAKIRDQDLPDAPARQEVWSAMVLPVPSLEPAGRSETPWLKIGVVSIAVAFVALIGVVIYLLGRDTPPPATQNTVAAAETAEDEGTPELGPAAGQGQVIAQNTAGQPATPDAAGAAPGAAGSAATPGAAAAPDDAAAAAAAAAGQTGDAAATDGATAEADAAAADETAAAAEEKKEEAKSSSSRRSSRSDRKSSRDKEKKSSSGSGLSKADVNKVIRGSFSKVRTCSRNADAKGKLNIKFGIKGDGRVSSAKVASSDFNGTRVGACVVKVVEGLKFPAHGGDTVSVNYPFHIN